MDPTHTASLDTLRTTLAAMGLDALIVRGTDRYLNEYVPTAESGRVWLTGFTGSTGDALVGRTGAWIFVDGRYHVQADREVDTHAWTVVKNPLGTSNEAACATQLRALARAAAGQGLRVGYEPDRYSVGALSALQQSVADTGVDLVPVVPSPVEALRGPVAPHAGTLRAVDEADAGRTVAEKLALVAAWLTERGADALLVQKLDEVAWITNLRGDEMPYQATFRAEALVTHTEVLLAVHTASVPDGVRQARPGVRFLTEDGLRAHLAGLGAHGTRPRIACDPASVTAAARDAVAAMGQVIPVGSPIVALKARKTPAELAAMRMAFARADQVVADAQRWLIQQVAAGVTVTEAGFAAQVETMFRASGAVGLSFRVISAYGVHGAVVHHPPSAETVIHAGELMLLDTGCYYDAGYATDLTRTFFVGPEGMAPTAAQQRLYTLTLKSAIAGMSARVPRNAVGAQLDGIARAPLWAEGLDYAHGTGHGVGINVHEAPPRIANTSTTPLEVGHVFSIEPGIYLEGVGGVRIENLCTVVPDPDHDGFLTVIPLTFAPLDLRLVDDTLLTASERGFLTWYTGRSG